LGRKKTRIIYSCSGGFIVNLRIKPWWVYGPTLHNCVTETIEYIADDMLHVECDLQQATCSLWLSLLQWIGWTRWRDKFNHWYVNLYACLAMQLYIICIQISEIIAEANDLVSPLDLCIKTRLVQDFFLLVWACIHNQIRMLSILIFCSWKDACIDLEWIRTFAVVVTK